MNLKLRNPLQGSREPWPLATRLARFVLTALALAFLHIASRTLNRLVEKNTGLSDPEALPDRPRKLAQALSYAATAVLFLGVWTIFTQGSYGFLIIGLAVLISASASWYLRRTVWGLPNAFREEGGSLGEILRRLLEVIRHGPP